MNLTPNFTFEEFTASDIAARRGIDNTPTPIAFENMKLLAAAMEEVRRVLGYPIHITSGYRSLQLNSAVGGSKVSAHIDGLACDFISSGFGPPIEVCRALEASKLPFDQVIHEFESWTHFAIAHRGLIGRREVLTIDKSGTRIGLEA